MENRSKIQWNFSGPVGLRLNSTSDISEEVLKAVFEVDNWLDEMDPNPDRLALYSAEPPSFLHLYATLEWWKQLGLAAGAIVASGYLNEAGSAIWRSQAEISKNFSRRLWSLAERIVCLHSSLPTRTQIALSFPTGQPNAPIIMDIQQTEIEKVASEIESLVIHAQSISDFIESNDFEEIYFPRMTIMSGTEVELSWCVRVADQLEVRSKVFYI